MEGKAREAKEERPMDPKQLLEILAIAEKLKCNTRHCDTSSGRRESVAEHSWRMTLMAMLLTGVEEYRDIDMNRVIRMCLIHDLGEAFTGDIPTFLKNGAQEEKEEAIFDRWVESFPSPQREEWQSLLAEMNALESREARLYKALDKLEAVIQHNESDLASWLPLEYDLQYTYPEAAVAFSPFLKQVKAEVDEWTTRKIREKGKDGQDP